MHASATLANWASRRLRRIGRAVVDGVLPPRCLACGETIEEPDALCGRCGGGGITFFTAPGGGVRGLRLAFCSSDGSGRAVRGLRPPAAELGSGARGVPLRQEQPPPRARDEA